MEIAQRKLATGQKRLHIVAPPGSGKTVLGLYLWAMHVRRPAVVFSPNSAIQAQWAARTDLFDLNTSPGGLVSTRAESPALLTSLTYQSITLPRCGGEDLDATAMELWEDRLVEKGQAKDVEEARVWMADLKQKNRAYYDERLKAYRKEARDELALSGDAMKTLHASSLAALEKLRLAGVGLIVLDECHHLLTHWGRVLSAMHKSFNEPIIVGLTATPPDRTGQLEVDLKRYDDYFGPIDYEVPVPAVVKDGFLAPYQDLVYFVRPTADELAFIANADKQFNQLVADLCRDKASPNSTGEFVCEEPLPNWITRVLTEKRLPTGVVKDWATFERRDPAFSLAGRLFLQRRGLTLPADVLPPDTERSAQTTQLAVLVAVLDRYIRHRLRGSENPADQALAERAIQNLRVLGIQVTETGTQACASPVGRVMAYAHGKTEALIPILKAERAVLGDRIRAVIVCDYEKTSAVSAEVSHLLNEEAGGAVAAFRALLQDPETDALDPVLVTGSTVLVDDDLLPKLVEHATAWLASKKIDVKLRDEKEAGFHVLVGEGGDWCPQVYVLLLTELFQSGVTRCLVGTRGLLGEGWDASKANVLIDLTTVTTSMSVNQLRGRSIRLDLDDPQKLADNWDVVCIAPEFSKGLDDYFRFIEKHRVLYGVTDDGAIEKGVGHVHAAFTELKPEGVEGAVNVLNDEMLARAARRDRARTLWKIGEPFHPEPVHALEVKPRSGGGGFPPFAGSKTAWSDQALTLAIGQAILGSLRVAKLVKHMGTVQAGERAGGYIRVFLQNAGKEDSALFQRSLHEALGPLDRPRYVIPRYVDNLQDTWLSRVLPEVLGKYFQQRRRQMAMLHTVPTALAENKDVVEIYQAYWNKYVSPGQAVFAQRGQGEQLVEQARRAGAIPQPQIHEKEVFL